MLPVPAGAGRFPMTDVKATVILPSLPAHEFFRDPRHVIITACRSALLFYDPKTQSGFIYQLVAQTWLVTAPVDFVTFGQLLAGSGYSLTPGPEANRWATLCGAAPAGAGKH